MRKRHVVLLETKRNIWVAYSISPSEAKNMSNAVLPQLHYFVFEYNLLLQQKYPYTMKLKYPLNHYYRVGKISMYREEEFEEKEKCLIVSYDDDEDYLSVTNTNF